MMKSFARKNIIFLLAFLCVSSIMILRGSIQVQAADSATVVADVSKSTNYSATIKVGGKARLLCYKGSAAMNFYTWSVSTSYSKSGIVSNTTGPIDKLDGHLEFKGIKAGTTTVTITFTKGSTTYKRKFTITVKN